MANTQGHTVSGSIKNIFQRSEPVSPGIAPKNVTFPVYALEIVTDIALGVICGLAVNVTADFLGGMFGLNKMGVLIIQLFLITIVLYIIKSDSRYLYSTWAR